jgi:hypothetical protein
MACILDALYRLGKMNENNKDFIQNVLTQVMPSLEGMVRDGWVRASYDRSQPLARLDAGFRGFHANQDTAS